MKLSVYSRYRILKSTSHLEQEYYLGSEFINLDFFDPIYNYLVHGFTPGSFFTAVLANDFASAILHSHPSNSIEDLKKLVRWIQSIGSRGIVHGDYDIVASWTIKSDDERRFILEEMGLIFTEEEEIIMTLRGDEIPARYMRLVEALA